MSLDTPLGPLPLLEDLGDLSGKRVLLRLDLNVPIEGEGEERSVADDFRILAALPTVGELVSKGARVTVATHLGRPKGRVDAAFGLEPVRARLAELAAEVELAENLRFDPGEEEGSLELAARLCEGQDLFVNDAFGAMHRAHASIVGPPQLLCSAAGRLVEREMAAIAPFLAEPPRPFVVVVGGAKVRDKLGLLSALCSRADRVLVGGGMAFTFLAALGHSIGDSLVEPELLGAVGELMMNGAPLLLPVDLVVAAPGVSPKARPATGSGAVQQPERSEARVSSNEIAAGWKGLDIGPATTELFREAISTAGSVLWNGPMGVFEDPRFARGTYEVARAVSETSAKTLVGGGDSAAALQRFGLTEGVDHVSTGGGASLELLEYGDLPGLKALRENLSRMREAS